MDLPPKINAAMQFLGLLQSKKGGDLFSESPSQDLSIQEKAVKKSALDCLNLYFLGECDYEPLKKRKKKRVSVEQGEHQIEEVGKENGEESV